MSKDDPASSPPSWSARPDSSLFRPHPLFSGGHAQTLLSALFPANPRMRGAVHHRVRLADGDELSLHDDRPANWRPGGRIVLLVHGLGGSATSGYLPRVSLRLHRAGIRTLRLNLRGAGDGLLLARRSYHGGRSEDLATLLRWVAEREPQSPVTVVGFSLGGNITLRLLGRMPAQPPSWAGRVDSAIAICPPIELKACSVSISRPANRIYNRHFLKVLMDQYYRRLRHVEDAFRARFHRPPRVLYDFDEHYVGPSGGFSGAEEYYARCSSAPLLPNIKLPTLIIASKDDPIIPVEIFDRAHLSASTSLLLAPAGGHMGFISRRSDHDPDRRWLDWRIVDWIMRRGSESTAEAAPAVRPPD